MKGYWQLVEGHRGGFMVRLRAGNHETILEGRVCWSRQAALDAVGEARRCSQIDACYGVHRLAQGRYRFELTDERGAVLGSGPPRPSRAAVTVGIASVRRNAPSTTFRGLVREDLAPG